MGHHDATLSKRSPISSILELKANIEIDDPQAQQREIRKSVDDMTGVTIPTDASPRRRLSFEVVLIAIIVAASFANAIALAIE